MAGERRAKIRFYAVMKRRVADATWPDGQIPFDWLKNGAPKVLDADSGELKRANAPGLANLSYGKTGNAHLPLASADDSAPDPDLIFSQIASETKELMHLRCWKVRRSQLPSLHNVLTGVTDVLAIGDDEGLAEAVDLLLFRKSCVVGVLVNRSGPSNADILAYLEKQTAVPMKFALLTREDALSIVNGDLVSSFEIEVAAGHFEALAEVHKDVAQSARQVDPPGLRSIKISVSAERTDRSAFWRWWEPKARKLTGLPREEVESLVVGQAATDESSGHFVNLLEDKIGLDVTVEVAFGRTVQPDAAYRALVQGHDQHVELIRGACDRLDVIAENQRAERKNAKQAAVVPAAGL